MLFGRLFQVLLTFIIFRVLTTIFTKSELGIIYYLIALQSFYTLFLINPVGQFFYRNIISWYNSGMTMFFLKKQLLYISSITFFVIISLGFLRYFNLVKLSFEQFWLIVALTFSQSFNQTILSLLNMIGKKWAYVNLNILTSIISLLLFFFLICFFDKKSEYWLYGIVFANLFLFFFAFNYLCFVLKGKIKELNLCAIILHNNADIFKIIKFSLPISIATLFMWYLSSGYRIQVEDHFGLAYLALIGVGLSISNQVFNIIESILTQYLIPDLYHRIENKNKNKNKIEVLFNNYLNVIIPIYLSIAIFLTFSIKNLLPFIVSESFADGYVIIIFGAWIEFTRVVTNALALASQIERKTNYFIPAYFLGSLFLIILFNVFLKQKSLICFYLLFANIVVLIFMGIMMKKVINFTLSWSRIFKIILYSIPSSLFFYYVSSVFGLNLENFILSSIGCIIFAFFLCVYCYFNIED
ncbi:hypothetical protein [Arsenophonus sp. ENCA]|uniref:hypothetical protein n=1 Tax=Arsenophonus sp. ENCA TaxID=1987579 RepID=UPI0025C585CD|nr:hypothetical protein [Arsenophonus sp. ENCA]